VFTMVVMAVTVVVVVVVAVAAAVVSDHARARHVETDQRSV
jgi:uncharacterized membrane protein